MGHDLVIVTELSETNNTAEHKENARHITSISFMWLHGSDYTLDQHRYFTSSQFNYAKARIMGKDTVTAEFEFDSSENLIKFGKSLIELAIPSQLINQNYEPEHIFSIISSVEKINFTIFKEMKRRVIEEIMCCDCFGELSSAMTKCQESIVPHMTKENYSDKVFLKYADYFEENDISMVKKIVNIGLEIIGHGKQGRKAYWSFYNK